MLDYRHTPATLDSLHAIVAELYDLELQDLDVNWTVESSPEFIAFDTLRAVTAAGGEVLRGEDYAHIVDALSPRPVCAPMTLDTARSIMQRAGATVFNDNGRQFWFTFPWWGDYARTVYVSTHKGRVAYASATAGEFFTLGSTETFADYAQCLARGGSW